MTCGECVHMNRIPGRESCSPQGYRSPSAPADGCGWAFPRDQLRQALYGGRRVAEAHQADLFGASA